MSGVEVGSGTDIKCLEEASATVEVVGNASSPRVDAETKELPWERDSKKSPSDEHALAAPAKNPWAKLKPSDQGKMAHLLDFSIIPCGLNLLRMKQRKVSFVAMRDRWLIRNLIAAIFFQMRTVQKFLLLREQRDHTLLKNQ